MKYVQLRNGWAIGSGINKDMKKSILSICFTSALLVNSHSVIQAQTIKPISVLLDTPTASTSLASATLSHTQALRAASTNFEVAIAKSAWVAAQADVLAADRAPFPILSGKLASIDLDNGIGGGNLVRDKRLDKSVGVDWTWERGGKRSLRTQVAKSSVIAAKADLQEIQILQLLAASSTYLDLLTAQERQQQIEDIASSTVRIAETAAKRAKAGDLARQDVLRLEIEASRGQSDARTAALEVKRARWALAQTMGVASVDQAVVWPDSTNNSISANTPQSHLQTRPDLIAAAERVNAARNALDLASSQNKADVTWGASLDHFPGTSRAQVELRFQVPLQWGYGYQGEIDRARAQLELAQDTLDKLRTNASQEVQRLQSEANAGQERSNTYQNEILPRAQTVAQQAERAYALGALALNDLLDARRTLRATQIEALSARAEQTKAAMVLQLRTQPVTQLLQP